MTKSNDLAGSEQEVGDQKQQQRPERRGRGPHRDGGELAATTAGGRGVVQYRPLQFVRLGFRDDPPSVGPRVGPERVQWHVQSASSFSTSSAVRPASTSGREGVRPTILTRLPSSLMASSRT